jgi:hypothetical protein
MIQSELPTETSPLSHNIYADKKPIRKRKGILGKVDGDINITSSNPGYRPTDKDRQLLCDKIRSCSEEKMKDCLDFLWACHCYPSESMTEISFVEIDDRYPNRYEFDVDKISDKVFWELSNRIDN